MEKPEGKSRLGGGKQQKGGPVSSSSSYVLSRSFTMHTKPTEAYPPNLPASLDRSGSTRSRGSGFYTPFSSLRGKVNKLRSLFDSKSSSKDSSPSSKDSHHHRPSKLGPARSLSSPTYPSIRLPGSENRIVVYFTSLHGIRRTFEDCYAVRMIFRGFRVWVDERDVSMDLEYKKELQAVLGERNVSLPQVFIGGAYVGGADAVKQLHDTGELAKLLDRFPRRAPGFVCNGCGDMRFVPCPNCSGSRKIFDEDDEGGVVPRRCSECNENGLVRCPGCCS
ncbi:hypothetical protein MLD38_003609 [Melastoma candidum]|uniref:Uncharacterized protein n=1 Tax=Melastoma candidum TaxID=119954 RepID=A0ACB9S2T9_9MYRT|nr:hypothetical protein MLD38_003609 [Melastoma candidum]